MANNVMDEPIIIRGGSLIIETQRKIEERHPIGPSREYEYPVQGQITSVEIDGTSYPANANSKIIIHYEVPHTP
jgi:hypothetical protein